MVVYPAPQFLQILIEPIRQPVIEFSKLHSLHHKTETVFEAIFILKITSGDKYNQYKTTTYALFLEDWQDARLVASFIAFPRHPSSPDLPCLFGYLLYDSHIFRQVRHEQVHVEDVGEIAGILPEGILIELRHDEGRVQDVCGDYCICYL